MAQLSRGFLGGLVPDTGGCGDLVPTTKRPEPTPCPDPFCSAPPPSSWSPGVWSWGADLNDYVAVQAAVQTNSRIIAFSRHYDTRMSAIYLRNIGPTARNWHMFLNDRVSNITAFAAQNGMRIVDWGAHSRGFDATLVEGPAPVAGWQLVNVPRTQVDALRRQQKARLLSVRGGFNDRFSVTLIDNANESERRARDLFDARSDGVFGLRVEEVGVGTLADIHGDLPFEPAETMSTLLHLHAMRQVELGNISLRNLLPVNVIGRSRPNGTGNPSPSGLGSNLEAMMEGNDLDRTYSVAPRRWSFADVNATANSLGLRDTRLQNVIGCGGPAVNVTTLRDLGSMHVLAGTRLSAANRATFRTAMENSKSFPTWETGGRDLMQRISDEAARRNFTLGRRIAFGGELEIAYKAGTYSLRNGNFVSEAEWTSVPCLVASGTITRREYVFGAFNAQAGARSVARGLVSDALLDAVWPLVRDAMETWDDGGIGRYGQGCPGARGVASLDSRDVPNIGTTVDLELAELPVAAPVSFWFGIRSTTPLPIPGTACELLLQPLHSVSTTSRYPGAATIPLSIPGDSTLAGVRLAVQCSVMDASANLLGFSFSNGLELRIGQ